MHYEEVLELYIMKQKRKEINIMEENKVLESYKAELRCLRSKLQANTSEIGDWKIIKCMEAKLLGEDLPYDINDLKLERQKIRDRINELEVLIEQESETAK